MLNPSGPSRGIVFVLIALLLLWGFHLGAYLDPSTSGASSSLFDFKSRGAKSPLSSHVHTYFEQVFSAEKPPEYPFSALKAACERTQWQEHNKNTFLRCDGINAGMTSIMSQVKVCFKMAIDAGVHMLLPDMPLRDSDDLLEFNLMNESAYMPFEQWFDQDHVLASMSRVCPQMSIRQTKDVGTPSMPVLNEWRMDIGSAPGFQMLSGYFWVGRPFKSWFDGELAAMRFFSSLSPKDDAEYEHAGELSRSTSQDGATILQIASQFLLFRLTDDPTGREVALWNDLSHLVRFTETPRKLTNRILSHIDRPFFGVHFRTERDNIWSSFENQLKVDLDALDQAWEKYGSRTQEKPLVYLACGDEGQIQKFSEAAAQRGWTVTSKYDIAKDYPVTLKMIKDMPFDFQGAVDMGVMLESHFFLGITGSAFSSSVANMRDSTGRYRGSSLLYPDDGNARTHLFNDGDASGYPCSSLARFALSTQRDVQAPQNKTDKLLHKMWCTVLGLAPEDFGVEADFFECGGDSTAAMKMASLARAGQLSLTVQDVYDYPVLGELSRLLEGRSGVPQSEALPEEAPFSLSPKSVNLELLKIRVADLCGSQPQGVSDIYPLTATQHSIVQQTLSRPGAFWLHNVFDIPETVDVGRLERAWRRVVSAHAILRTRIISTHEGELLQAVMASPDEIIHADCPSTDVDALIAADKRRELGFGQPLARAALLNNT